MVPQLDETPTRRRKRRHASPPRSESAESMPAPSLCYPPSSVVEEHAIPSAPEETGPEISISTVYQLLDVIKVQEEMFQGIQRREEGVQKTNHELRVALASQEAEHESIKKQHGETLKALSVQTDRQIKMWKDTSDFLLKRKAELEGLTKTLELEKSHVLEELKKATEAGKFHERNALENAKVAREFAVEKNAVQTFVERLRGELRVNEDTYEKTLKTQKEIIAQLTREKEVLQEVKDQRAMLLERNLQDATERERAALEKIQGLEETNTSLLSRLPELETDESSASYSSSSPPLQIASCFISHDRHDIHFEPPFLWTPASADEPQSINSLRALIDILVDENAYKVSLSHQIRDRNPWDQIPHLLPLASCVARFRQWANILEEPALKELLSELEVIQMNMLASSGSALYPPTELEARRMDEVMRQRLGSSSASPS